MTLSPHRKRRASETQTALANDLAARPRGFWPYATPAGAGRGGRDVLNTEGVAIEVKARADLDLPGWLRQAHRHADDSDVPIVVARGPGQGPVNVGAWASITRWEFMVELLEEHIICTTVVEALERGDGPVKICEYLAAKLGAVPRWVDRDVFEE